MGSRKRKSRSKRRRSIPTADESSSFHADNPLMRNCLTTSTRLIRSTQTRYDFLLQIFNNPVFRPDDEPGWISQDSLINRLIFSCIIVIILVYYLFTSGLIQPINKGECPAKILGLVGVETTYGSADLRAALRTTWFPAYGHANFRERTMEFVFVIEKTKGRRMKEIQQENLKYGDILILKQSEPISALDKTLEFFKAASKKYDAEYYIKADEHIYLRPDRLATILLRNKREPLEYIGCQKTKRHINGKYDFVFAHGSLYILSAKAVNKLIKASRQSLLRYKSSAEVAVGYAMDKALVKLEEQKDLCQSNCSPKFIAVSVFSSCSTGPCNPVNKLKELHTSTVCAKTPTLHYHQFYGE